MKKMNATQQGKKMLDVTDFWDEMETARDYMWEQQHHLEEAIDKLTRIISRFEHNAVTIEVEEDDEEDRYFMPQKKLAKMPEELKAIAADYYLSEPEEIADPVRLAEKLTSMLEAEG